MKNKVDRRRFVNATVAAGAALSAPYVVPSTVFGANESLTMGIIGAGGRGRGVMGSFQHLGCKFAAVCDARKSSRIAGLERAEENNEGKIDQYIDYREMLERKDLDAVLIATPEHQHCTQLIDVVNAGMDSYCEKPMSHSIKEGAKTVKAVRKTKQIVQIGMQRRSSSAVWQAKDVVQSGILGKIPIVRAEWNWDWSGPLGDAPLPEEEVNWDLFKRPARRIEYAPRKVTSWRWFWAFSGGNVTDQGTHLMDVIQWFMGAKAPLTAECTGRIVRMTNAETPDLFSALYQYPDFMATWTLNYNSTYNNDWSITFQGIKGTMRIDGGGYKIYLEPCRGKTEPDKEFKGGIPTGPHVENFVDCVKTRKEPNAPVEVGHLAVSGPHLANCAYRKGRRAKLNEAATRVSY